MHRDEEFEIRTHVALAERHIETGLRLITEQQALIARLRDHKADPVSLDTAQRLLATFMSIQDSHLASRQEGLKYLAVRLDGQAPFVGGR